MLHPLVRVPLEQLQRLADLRLAHDETRLEVAALALVLRPGDRRAHGNAPSVRGLASRTGTTALLVDDSSSGNPIVSSSERRDGGR